MVEDGIGANRRTRRFHKATCDLTRLLIVGHSGYISLEALRWLTDAGISLIHLDSNGRILTTSAMGADKPALRRAQAWASTNKTGISVIRYLLTEKLQGQARVAERNGSDCGEIKNALDLVADCETLDELRIQEMQAAVAYWQTWDNVELRFIRADQKRIPAHWRSLGNRRSTKSSSPRLAVTPINAILNYLYSLLEAESRIAALAVGLDPGLGILHTDQHARDSFALDLMEAGRPQVDEYVLDLIDGHTFRLTDFHDTRRGICRIGKPLAHRLSETTQTWAEAIARPAETTAGLLANTPGIKGVTSTTPLTQSNRRTSKGSAWNPNRTHANKTHPDRLCQWCGKHLDDGGRLCGSCRIQFHEESEWLRAGRQRLTALRDVGDDPAHGGTAREKRAAKVGAENRKSASWNRQHPDRPDPSHFEKEILPSLAAVSLKDMAAAIGLSIDYCSKIRRGLKTPHARHWSALASLIEQMSCSQEKSH